MTYFGVKCIYFLLCMSPEVESVLKGLKWDMIIVANTVLTKLEGLIKHLIWYFKIKFNHF